MDIDLDFDAFDPSAFISTPSPSPSPFAPPLPSPPLWIFDDNRAPEISEDCLRFLYGMSGNSDDATPITDGANANSKKLPDDNSDASSCIIIKERMAHALGYLNESTGQHVLVQVWAPVKNGDRYVLTTAGQPFVLDSPSTKLLQYRMVSLMYTFSVDGESGCDDSDLREGFTE